MAVNATAVWRVGPSGSNTNGGGYDPGIAGAATDYSQQNAAQATGTHGTTTGTTTFTDLTAANFTSAMIGNAMYITGTGQTTGWYFITAFTSSSVVTLDRSPGTGTLATWNLGGRWADFWTNTNTTAVGGNTVYILGSGTPNPSSYTYDYVAPTFTLSLNTGNKIIFFSNDPNTPGYKAPPDTTGGMPCIQFTGVQIFNVAPGAADNLGCKLSGLWFVGGAGIAAGSYVLNSNSPTGGATGNCTAEGCVLDQFGFDVGMGKCAGTLGAAVVTAFGCEVFSSQGGTGGVNAAFYANNSAADLSPLLRIIGCNIHDCVGYGIYGTITSSFNDFELILLNSIIAKCAADGVYCDTYDYVTIANCTIDGNTGSGINCGTVIGYFLYENFYNNIISNHTGAGKFGINFNENASNVAAGAGFLDYNTFYNNAADLSNSAAYGPHDTHGGSNPYVAQSTENYTLV